GLCRIDMEDDAVLAADVADGLDVLNHADLVVDQHDRCQHGVRPDRGAEFLDVDQAVRFRLQEGGLETEAFQLAYRIDDGLVFGHDRDDVFALAAVEVGSALDRQIVGFGGAGGPDDLARVGVDQLRHFLARVLDSLFRHPAEGVAARSRVAEVFGQVGDHLFRNTGVNRRGSGIVQI